MNKSIFKIAVSVLLTVTLLFCACVTAVAEGITLPFKDVPINSWYREAVEFCYENSLFLGVSSDEFNPQGGMTRAMMVTALYRQAGAPEFNKMCVDYNEETEAYSIIINNSTLNIDSKDIYKDAIINLRDDCFDFVYGEISTVEQLRNNIVLLPFDNDNPEASAVTLNKRINECAENNCPLIVLYDKGTSYRLSKLEGFEDATEIYPLINNALIKLMSIKSLEEMSQIMLDLTADLGLDSVEDLEQFVDRYSEAAASLDPVVLPEFENTSVPVVLLDGDNIPVLSSIVEAYSNCKFSDCKKDSWYEEAVIWATNTNVVSGYDDGTFKPDKLITRQELAVLLFNYYTFGGLFYFVPEEAGYADRDSISSWATTAVDYVTEIGMMKGMSYDGNGNPVFSPKTTVTRAQAAQLFMNMNQVFVME